MTAITDKTAGRVTGGLFLSAVLLYGGGTFLVTAATDGAVGLPHNAGSLLQLSAGATLLLANSVAVTGIGALAFRVLRGPHPRTGSAYLLTRAAEALLLGLAPVGMLLLVGIAGSGGGASDGSGSGLGSLARAAVENGEPTYWVAMTILGVGSVFFCRTLLTSGLLPRLLAAGGMVAYAAFALGSALQLAGYEVGLALSAPGGLFEVAAGSLLLIKGFPEALPPAVEAADSAEPQLIGVVVPVA